MFRGKTIPNLSPLFFGGRWDIVRKAHHAWVVQEMFLSFCSFFGFLFVLGAITCLSAVDTWCDVCCSWVVSWCASSFILIGHSYLSQMANPLADSFTVLSWNVRGLGSKFKRALLFQYLKSHAPQIIILQETHLMSSKILMLKNPWIQRAIHATYSTYARGVSILKSQKLSLCD